MAKKKHSKKQKEQILRELEKAQNRSFRGFEELSYETKPEKTAMSEPTKETSDVHVLPVGAIKQDLFKIILFAVFSIATLILLDVGNIDIEAIKGFVRF